MYAQTLQYALVIRPRARGRKKQKKCHALEGVVRDQGVENKNMSAEKPHTARKLNQQTKILLCAHLFCDENSSMKLLNYTTCVAFPRTYFFAHTQVRLRNTPSAKAYHEGVYVRFAHTLYSPNS